MNTSSSVSLCVVKIGGRPQSDSGLPDRVAAAWRARPGALVIVHGGGDEISALQRVFETTPRFVDGRRVTSEQDIETLRMALSGAANKRLVARLRAVGVPALGLSGEDAGLLMARPMDPGRFGEVGSPERVDVALLRHLLAGGVLPVLSPLAASSDQPGRALNVNGDDAAAAIAAATSADELLLVADVPGVLSGGAVVPTLSRREAEGLMADGTASGGMRAKIEAALAALDGGVSRVRIGDLTAIDHPHAGTTFTSRDTSDEQHQQPTNPSLATTDRSVA